MSESQQHPNRRRRKQSVWFVRYGLTEHPLLEDLGPYDSDIDPGEGIDHAVSIAKRIARGIDTDSDGRGDTDSISTVVYASPFLRTAHTGYIVANELQQQQQHDGSDNSGSVELRLEEGLWEWLIPSLLVTKADGIKTNPRHVTVLNEDLQKLEEKRVAGHPSATIAVDYQSVNPYDDSGDVGIVCVPPRENTTTANATADGGTPPLWTESEADLLARCETTLSRLLDLHQTDAQSFCIVSHAPCDQAMAFFLEQRCSCASTVPIETPKDSKLNPWPLGGITVFSRPIVYEHEDGSNTATGFGDWTMELYGNTEHMPGAYKTGLKEWSLPCFAK